jgi:hypothetical protein
LRIALRKLERDFQSDTTNFTPKQKQLSKQGIGLEQEQQDSELKGIIKQMHIYYMWSVYKLLVYYILA